MKKSIALLEVIFSIFILSIIVIFSLTFYQTIQTQNKTEFEVTLDNLQLTTTQLFIEHLLKNSVKITSNGSILSFYKIDTQAFLQGFYSGVAVLEQSNKSRIFTPKSQAQLLTSSYIVFNDSIVYETIPSSENNYIYFKDNQNKKNIYEHYKMVIGLEKIELKNATLYYNDYLLLENVSAFSSHVNNQLLTINICLKNNCQEWVISL